MLTYDLTGGETTRRIVSLEVWAKLKTLSSLMAEKFTIYAFVSIIRMINDGCLSTFLYIYILVYELYAQYT